MKKRYFIFVPGLGDNYSFYKFAMRNWEKEYGLTPAFRTIGWKENKTFDEPLKNLLRLIDEFAKKGKVSLTRVSHLSLLIKKLVILVSEAHPESDPGPSNSAGRQARMTQRKGTAKLVFKR